VQTVGPLHLQIPQWTSFDWRAALLAALAGWLIFRLGWNVIKVLALVGMGGLLLGQAG
jgi:chromate transporter